MKAHWLNRTTIAWNVVSTPTTRYFLHHDPDGGLALGSKGVEGGRRLELRHDPAGLGDLQAKFPHLAGMTVLNLDDTTQIPAILKGQMVIAAYDAADNLIDSTGLQIPGVLDDLFRYDGDLGIRYDGPVPTLRLWAPTARSVALHLFADSTSPTPSDILPMTSDALTGVWSLTGDASWTGRFYLFDVELYVPIDGKVEHNLVTDPYSLSLSTNSLRSQIVDLADSVLMPPGWLDLQKPELAALNDIVLYELHVRDFSMSDDLVPANERGTFRAFTHADSHGMRHLKALADAGLTHIHLLPVFDFATVNEDKNAWQVADWATLAALPPDSDQQARLIQATGGQNPFNWGYDPVHYTAPEGSYATDPDGAARVLEFREMVQALSNAGLRVVMDVVYNHTNASGQNLHSVLDKIVPGYYHRLNAEGRVETSTCCQNTATEHAMMEKLMVDSVRTWATAYKVDGFRFDLMGHHMVWNIEKVRDTLRSLTPERDGVDGSKIYVYGEGWNFGEVANNARGRNAGQLNMAGSGIGTFNDRLRDAARGGGPFSGALEQGFVTGLFTEPNSFFQGWPDEQRAKVLRAADLIRVGLSGNLREYQMVDANGVTVCGADVLYNGAPTGYALTPLDTISYVEAHDNETLFDIIQLKAADSATLADRVRMQNLGNALVLLGQGVPFVQAGQELLRSKSGYRDSYNAGDWFNRLDWTMQTHGWGSGLPGEETERNNLLAPLLRNPALKPGRAEIEAAAEHFKELLRIRRSAGAFRLATADEIGRHLRLPNTGPGQVPGLIVMLLLGSTGDPFARIVVIFNANKHTQTFTDLTLTGHWQLHPVQQTAHDPVVRQAVFANDQFVVPGRTTAVFVELVV